MAGTPINPSLRYTPAGKRRWLWVPTTAGIANITAPTRLELEAGTDLSPEVAASAGFSVSTTFEDSADLGSRKVQKVIGQETAEDSSITFWASADSADVRAVLHEEDEGFIVQFPEGDVPTQKMNVFRAAVGSVSFDPDQTAVQKIPVSFALRDWEFNVTIPS